MRLSNKLSRCGKNVVLAMVLQSKTFFNVGTLRKYQPGEQFKKGLRRYIMGWATFSCERVNERARIMIVCSCKIPV